MFILSWIASKLSLEVLQQLFGGIVSIYAKSKDTKLAGLQAVVGAEATQNVAFLSAQVETNRIREAGNHSLVAMVIIGVFNIPFAVHIAAYTLDHTFTMNCNHYGCWGIPELTGAIGNFEYESLRTFLIGAPFLPVISSAASRLAAKL